MITQHRTTTINVHALSRIRTHELSVQAIKAYASDRAATETGYCLIALGTILR
jgi:hypothetical protein